MSVSRSIESPDYRALPRSVGERQAALFTVKLVAVPLLLAPFTANPVLTISALCLLPLMTYLLWRPAEPPALLFATFYQWVQVFNPLAGADLVGLSIGVQEELPNMEQAAALALIGLALLASGMRIGRGRVSAQFYGDAYLDLATVSPPRLSLVYALSFALKILLTNVMWLSPGLTQFIVPLIALQSAVVFLVFVAATHDRRFRSLAYLVAVVELAFSFTGFFANFKEVFFLAFIALATRIGALPSVTKRLLPVAAALLLLLGAGWQAVKIDYRSFLTAGAETQVITAPISERVEYLAHAISSVNASDLMNGLSTMATRLGYLDYFAYALETVPDYISHQYGRLWLESFERVMQPRFLFPDKPIVDDSVRTRQYTGLAVAGADEGASIGLDYFTESYIDFGRYLMFGPIFLVGIMWGKIYRWFARRSKYRLIDIAVATTLIVPNAIFLERSTIKLVGGTLSACMVTFVATVFLCRPLAALLQNFRKGR